MKDYVVDACVIAKWFTDEPYAEQAAGLFKQSNNFFAPDYLSLEFDNIVTKWLRRSIIDLNEAQQIRQLYRQLNIYYYSFHKLQDHAFDIAALTGRALYDCLYLSLAVLIHTPVITADKKFYQSIAETSLKKHIVWIGDIS